MNELETLIEKHYKKKKGNLTFQALIEMVEKTMENLSPLFEETLAVSYDGAEGEVPAELKNGVRLPIFKITELWGKVDNKDREIIEQFTKNLGGWLFV